MSARIQPFWSGGIESRDDRAAEHRGRRPGRKRPKISAQPVLRYKDVIVSPDKIVSGLGINRPVASIAVIRLGFEFPANWQSVAVAGHNCFGMIITIIVDDQDLPSESPGNVHLNKRVERAAQ